VVRGRARPAASAEPSPPRPAGLGSGLRRGLLRKAQMHDGASG